MKKYISLIISAVNAAALAVFIGSSDAQTVPIHYGINGAADKYAGKWSLLALSLLPLIISVVFAIYRILTVNNKNIAANTRYENKVVMSIILFFIFISWVITATSLSAKDTLGFNIMGIICFALGLLMMFISNLLAKLKPNRTTGIRIKATLSNETVWKKTHRLSGYTGMAGGFIMLICGAVIAFNGSVKLFILAIAAFLILECIVPTVYANVIFRKISDKN